jgi:hypothetical protein
MFKGVFFILSIGALFFLDKFQNPASKSTSRFQFLVVLFWSVADLLPNYI